MFQKEKSKKLFILLCLFIGLLHVLLLFYYGSRKEGFHEDEYYSYWSSAGNAWLYPSDDPYWRSGYDFQYQFMVNPGEEFQFSAVIANQAADVHPPLYYLALNIIMSFFSGHMYKWSGILLNTLFSAVTYCGILFFVYQLGDKKHRELCTLAAGLSYAIAPSVISNVMLTRMYAMSSMWTVLYTCLFLLLIKKHDSDKKHFALLTAAGALLCYASFLTHYFCLLIPFFLTLAFCIYTLMKRSGILRMLVYGACMLASIGLAVLTYPVCLEHIFKGYRGTGALAGLQGSLTETLTVFLPILNRKVFAGFFPVLTILSALCCFAGILSLLRRKKGSRMDTRTYCLIAIILSCVAGLCILSKVAMYCGDAACRYFYPVITLIIPLMAFIISNSLLSVADRIPFLQKTAAPIRGLLALLLCLLISTPYFIGNFRGDVLFLYEDEASEKAFSWENAEYPAVILYNTNHSYRTWFFANRLWPYQDLYFSSCDDMMQSKNPDPRLKAAEKVIVYISGSEDVLKKMLEQYPNLDSYTQIPSTNEYFATFVLE